MLLMWILKTEQKAAKYMHKTWIIVSFTINEVYHKHQKGKESEITVWEKNSTHTHMNLNSLCMFCLLDNCKIFGNLCNVSNYENMIQYNP